jgi:hypothetical protein
MKKTIKLLAIVAISLVMHSCTDASRSKWQAIGLEHDVELINCDGTITHSWVSSGKVYAEVDSDGYYFNDKKTDVLVRVSGNLIITPRFDGDK